MGFSLIDYSAYVGSRLYVDRSIFLSIEEMNIPFMAPGTVVSRTGQPNVKDAFSRLPL
jgi:hypothetical protein